MIDSLLKAILSPPDQAEPHWRAWRAWADLDRLDDKALLMLPLLADRLPQWLSGDPARALLLGIAKRCWTQNQLKLREIEVMLKALDEAGIRRVALTGSAAWAFFHRPALRPIESIELLIRRDQLARAARVLERLRWTPARQLPVRDELDRTESVWFDRDADRLKLSWRLLPWSPEIAADYENLPKIERVRVFDQDAFLLESEAMLVAALAGYRAPVELDWRCDAVRLLRSRRIDWRRMRGMLLDQPQALPRMRELQQDWGIAVPDGVFRGRGRGLEIWSDYRWRAWEQRRARSLGGFAAYLCDRWWRVFVKAR